MLSDPSRALNLGMGASPSGRPASVARYLGAYLELFLRLTEAGTEKGKPKVRYDIEISRNGPYLQVLLPNVLPPDWEALRRELEPELDEGASLVTLVVGECAGVTRGDPRCCGS